MRSRSGCSMCCMIAVTFAIRFAWVTTTPLGAEVEPACFEKQTSSGDTSTASSRRSRP